DGSGLVRHPHCERAPIGVGVHGHRADPHFPQRPNDADRDLSPIGDENFAKHRSAIVAGRAGVYPCTRFSLPVQNFSRSERLKILPVPVLGSGSVESSIRRGSLNFAMRCSRNRSSSSAVSVSPSFSDTMATGISPQRGSGAETTAHSKSDGCAKMAFSTSIDEIFSPPLMIMSFLRSTM